MKNQKLNYNRAIDFIRPFTSPSPYNELFREKVMREGQGVARGNCGHQTDTAPAKSLRSDGDARRILAFPLCKCTTYRPKCELNEMDSTYLKIFIGDDFKYC